MAGDKDHRIAKWFKSLADLRKPGRAEPQRRAPQDTDGSNRGTITSFSAGSDDGRGPASGQPTRVANPNDRNTLEELAIEALEAQDSPTSGREVGAFRMMVSDPRPRSVGGSPISDHAGPSLLSSRTGRSRHGREGVFSSSFTRSEEDFLKVVSAVQSHNATHGTTLAVPSEMTDVTRWGKQNLTGSVIKLDTDRHAAHTGRGRWEILDRQTHGEYTLLGAGQDGVFKGAHLGPAASTSGSAELRQPGLGR
jgi:hypothetical protein